MAWIISDGRLWSLTDKDEVGNAGNLRLRSNIDRDNFGPVLEPAKCTHAHTSDNLTLTQSHTLVVQESLHGHLSDNLKLFLGILEVQDTLHAHNVDNVILQAGITTILNTANQTDFVFDDTPTLEFTADSLLGYDIEYQIQIDTVNTFDTPLLNKLSSIPDAGFLNTVTGGDTHPFNDNEKISYTVQDTDILLDSFLGTSIVLFPFDNGITMNGQSFLGGGKTLASCKFELRKLGTPTGNLTARLYAHSGTYGAGGIPTGFMLTESITSIAVSTLTTSGVFYEFLFDNTVRLVDGTPYFIVVYCDEVDNDANRPAIGSRSSGHGGNLARYVNGVWQAETEDALFYVYETEALVPGTYYWRVRAIEPLGDNEWGGWSGIREFYIEGVPAITTLISPPDLATDIPITFQPLKFASTDPNDDDLEYQVQITPQLYDISLQGNQLAITGVDYGNLAKLSSTRVALTERGNDTLSTYDWDGTDWSLVGNAFSLGASASQFYICALSSTRVAVFNNIIEEIRAYDFDGTNWSLTGNAFTMGVETGYMCALSSTRIVISNQTTNDLESYDFDGTNWTKTGNSYAITSDSNGPVEFMSGTEFCHLNSDGLQVYDFDGTDFTTVGNLSENIIYSSAGAVSTIIMLTSTRMLHFSIGNDYCSYYDWDGTDWKLLGSTSEITIDNESFVQLTSTSFAAINNRTTGILGLRKYDFIQNINWRDTAEIINPNRAADISTYSYCVALSRTRMATFSSGVDRLHVWEWDGMNWYNPNGNTKTITNTFAGIGALSETRLVIAIDSATDTLRAIDYNPATGVFSDVGTNANISGVTDTIAFCVMNAAAGECVFVDEANLEMSVYTFNGSTWSKTGNSYTIPTQHFTGPKVTALSATRIVFYDSTDRDFQTFDWDGTDFSPVGNAFGPVVSSGIYVAMDGLTSSMIAWSDATIDKVTRYSFDGTDWTRDTDADVTFAWAIYGSLCVFNFGEPLSRWSLVTGSIIHGSFGELWKQFKSETDAGFTAGHPFTSGENKQLFIQPSILEPSTKYSWRVRAIDPLGSNIYGGWSTAREFTTGISQGLAVNSSYHGHLSDNLILQDQAHTLVVQDSLHAHLSDNLLVTQTYDVVVQDSTHSHLAEGDLILAQSWNLVVADTVHSHLSDNLVLVQSNTLVVQESLHSHLVDNVALTQKHTLIVAESLHSHLSDNLLLTQSNVLVVAESLHNHLSESISFLGIGLIVNESLHSHLSDNLALAQSYTLVVAETLHDHITDNVTLTQKHTLVTVDTLHAHVTDNVVLVEAETIAIQDTVHSHIVDNVVLTQKNTLVVQESLHGHLADNIVLTQSNTLIVQGSLHSHLVDNVAVTQKSTLVIEDSLHSHLSDNLVLVQSNTLVVDETLHSHTVDNVALTQKHTLIVAETLHGHLSDNLILELGVFNLLVQDSVHSHLSDNLILTQKNTLIVTETLHSHLVENVILTQSNILVVNDTLHGHSADNVILVEAETIAIQDTVHAHNTDNLVLTQENTLVVQDSLHGHLTDNIVLSEKELLTVQDALHSHSAEGDLVLDVKYIAVAQDSLHAHIVDNIALVQSHILVVADSLHGHIAENVVLTEEKLLTIQNALHSHLSENVALVQSNTLIVDESLHGHLVEGDIILTQSHALVVEDTLHGHLVDNIVLVEAELLTIQDSLHSHSAENTILVQSNVLEVQDSVHGHVSDNLDLEEHSILIVEDSIHTHVVENVVLVEAEVLAIQDSIHTHFVDNTVLAVKALLAIDDSDHIHTADNIILTEAEVLTIFDTVHAHTSEEVILVQAHELTIEETLHSHAVEVITFIKVKFVTMIARYPTGSTVTIDIINLDTDVLLVDNGAVSEIGTTGYFKYKIAGILDVNTEYIYIMTDGITEQFGKLIFREDVIGEIDNSFSPWTVDEKDAAIAWSRKASDNAEQAKLKLS